MRILKIKMLTAILICLSISVWGKEIAFIKFDYLDGKERTKKRFEELNFSINGQALSPDKKTHKITLKEDGFDEFRYGEHGKLIEKTFFTKFRENEIYIIRFDICTNAYVLFAEKKPARGEVKFINKSKNEIVGEIAHFQFDRINKKSESEFIFAMESANCYFKVCPIKIYSSDYNDEDDFSDEELEKMLLGEIYFHFLHAEKLIVEFSQKGKLNLRIEK